MEVIYMTEVCFITKNEVRIVTVEVGMKRIPITKDLCLISGNECEYKGVKYKWRFGILSGIFVVVEDENSKLVHIEKMCAGFPFSIIKDKNLWRFIPKYDGYYNKVTESRIYEDMGLSEEDSIKEFKTRGRILRYILDSMAKDHYSIVDSDNGIHTAYGGMIVSHRRSRPFKLDNTGCCGVFIGKYNSKIAVIPKDSKKANHIIFIEDGKPMITSNSYNKSGVKCSKTEFINDTDKANDRICEIMNAIVSRGAVSDERGVV